VETVLGGFASGLHLAFHGSVLNSTTLATSFENDIPVVLLDSKTMLGGGTRRLHLAFRGGFIHLGSGTRGLHLAFPGVFIHLGSGTRGLHLAFHGSYFAESHFLLEL
jgi:hypothetical protein